MLKYFIEKSEVVEVEVPGTGEDITISSSGEGGNPPHQPSVSWQGFSVHGTELTDHEKEILSLARKVALSAIARKRLGEKSPALADYKAQTIERLPALTLEMATEVEK